MSRKRSKKAKSPTLAALEAEEKQCSDYLQYSAEHYAYSIDLPDIDAADEEELDSAEGEVEDAIEHCNNLVYDAENWLNAYRH